MNKKMRNEASNKIFFYQIFFIYILIKKYEKFGGRKKPIIQSK